MRRVIALLAIAVVQGPVLAQDPQPPKIRSGVELVAVDVHVVDRNGNPLADLKREDFEVAIGGRVRRVLSAQLVSYAPGATAAAPAADAPQPAGGETAPRPRRMYVLAVDEHSLHISNAVAAVKAGERFIDRLQPDDLVGLYAYPTGTARHDLTNDHASVRRAIAGITGLYDEQTSRFNLSPTEAIDIASNDRDAVMTVLRRECGTGAMGCTQTDIRNEAISMTGGLEMRVSQSVGGLRALVRSLGAIPGRKTLVMVSGGLISTDRGTGRANMTAEISGLGREAAEANLSVFALHLDWSFLEAVSGRRGLRLSYFRDSNMAATGLEMVAGTAGGSVFRVQGTSPDAAFDRVLRETSAHYLLGIDVAAEDRDGSAHAIRVKVKRRGATVRSRTSVIIPR